MKKNTLIILGLLCLKGAFAQGTAPKVVIAPDGSRFAQCTSFEITRPFRELADEQASQRKNDLNNPHEMEDRRRDKPPVRVAGVPVQPDPVVQTTMGSRVLTPPTVNFTAQSPGQGSPLDPTGAAGLTDYVQAVNCNYRAYNKTTGAALMNSLNLSTLWSGSQDAGDPIVLYDKLADRWFISQFQLPNSNKVLIAISTTNDPTGSFYKYTFTMNQGNDYLKFAIWPDGYYMSANWHSPDQVMVFDRTKMLAGNPAAGSITSPSFNLPNPGGFFLPSIADADGTLPPAGTPACMFSYEDDNSGGPADEIHIYSLTTNWTANTLTVAENTAGGSPLLTAPFNSTFTATAWQEISQKSSSQGIDAIQGIFMFRTQYRKWTGYNTVLLNNVVNADGNGKAGIRWYELRQNTTTGMWSIYQQATYSPDANNRWMGSLAMDDNGNIGMGMCVSGTSAFPSLHYTGRYPGDPLGTMPFAEQIATTGTAAKSGNDRWGDYSHTSLDPDGKTFWHTGMWMGNSGETSQIFNFQITPSVVTGIAEDQNTPKYTAYLPDNNTLLVKASNLATNEEVVVDLFDIDGRQISGKKIVPATNAFETNFSTAGLAKGTYLVRIGNINFQKVIKVILN
jgi:hypothetical protein